MIETHRLILKPISLDDVPAYQAAFKHPEFYYAGANGVGNDAKGYVIKRLEMENINDPERPFSISFSICLKAEDNKVIGYRSYGDNHIIERLSIYGMELGSFIHPDYWGQGYASEALADAIKHGQQEYGHRKFYATVSPDNIGSIRVLEKNGLRKIEEISDPDELRFFNGHARHVYTIELS